MKTYLSPPTIVALVFLSFNVQAQPQVHYVNSNCTNPVSPYTDWTTAATNIQDAVDAATNGDLVLVTDGVYQTGGAVTTTNFLFFPANSNRVAVTRPMTIQSVNGAMKTVIQGGTNASIRCVFLTNGASLSGFTLLNGHVGLGGGGGGGGVFCYSSATVSDCIIISNSAPSGGGAYGGTLRNCVLIQNYAVQNGGGAMSISLINCLIAGNLATHSGGGACSATLVNCTLTNNTAAWAGGGGGGAASSTLSNCILTKNSAVLGGGAFGSILNSCILTDNFATNYAGGAIAGTLNNCTVVGNTAGRWGGGVLSQYWVPATVVNNCIIFYNTAPSYPNCDLGAFNFCDTTPLPSGSGNTITNEPAFVDWMNGDFHLQANSPCINSGNNAFVISTNDLDGNPRISGGTVDIGAYEFQNPSSILSYAWLQQYGLPTDGSADNADYDGTGLNVYQDWIAGLNPTNALSVLKMTSATATNNPSGLVVTWQSVTNRTYFLQRATDLTAQPAFSTIQSNIVGQAGTTSYLDPTAIGSGPYFYRVGVQ